MYYINYILSQNFLKRLKTQSQIVQPLTMHKPCFPCLFLSLKNIELAICVVMTGKMIPNPVYVMTNKHHCLDVMIKKVKKKLQQEHAYALQKMGRQEFALKIPPPQNSG